MDTKLTVKGEPLKKEYKAKLWQAIGALLLSNENAILDVLQDRGLWRPPKVQRKGLNSKPERYRDKVWVQDVLQRLEPLILSGSWPAIVVRFRIGFVFGMGDRTGELRLSNRVDLDETRWIWKVMHPKGEDTYGDKGAELDVFTDTRPFVVDFLEARERRLRALGLDPAKVKPLCPNENGEHYTEAGWRGQRDKVFHRMGVPPNDDERAGRRTHGKRVVERLQAKGHVEASIIDYGSKRLRNTMQVFQDFYADLEAIQARKVIAEAYESFSASGTEGGLNSA